MTEKTKRLNSLTGSRKRYTAIIEEILNHYFVYTVNGKPIPDKFNLNKKVAKEIFQRLDYAGFEIWRERLDRKREND